MQGAAATVGECEMLKPMHGGMTTSRRAFLGAMAAPAALTGAPTQNVVVLLSDEHNPRFSAPYGHPFVETPNMLRLARMGTVFTNVYCPSPLCMPSRSAFLSGRRVFELQTYGNCNVFSSDEPSYGRVLAGQDAGWDECKQGRCDESTNVLADVAGGCRYGADAGATAGRHSAGGSAT